MPGELKIFSGNSNILLAKKICNELGVYLGDAEVKNFSDDETSVEISENVRGSDIFIIQSTCTPGNHNLMELLIMIDAFKRASAKRITAVLPYYGYARQDRKVAPRAPITAKLVADLLVAAGTHRILTIDLHVGQIQGFFNITVDHLFAAPVILKYIKEELQDNLIVVSPDAGGVERVRAFAKRLNTSIAIIDKRRTDPNQSEVMNVVGEIKDRNTLLLDDLIDTAGTITQSAQVLKERGAQRVFACCTHPVLSGSAIEKLETSILEEVIVTDTIPLNESGLRCSKIKILSVANLLAEAIKRIHNDESVSSLFV